MTEQQKFEAALSCEEDWGHRSFKKRKDGRYENWAVHLAWDAWQARAAQDNSAELLEALVDVLGWFPGRQAWHTDEPIKAVERARAAISKARGE